MDKLEKLYNFYLDEGLISDAISFEKWKSIDSVKQEKLFELGKSKGLFKTATAEQFKGAWSDTAIPTVKKKDEGMELPSEDGSLVSSENEVTPQEDTIPQVRKTSGFVPEGKTIETEEEVVVEKGFDEQGFGTEQTPEQDFFTGTFGDILKTIDQYSPIGIGDFIDDQARAIAGGVYQGVLAENASNLLLEGSKASDEDIDSYLESLRDSQKYGSSDEFNEYQKIYQENGKGILGVVLGLASTGLTVVPEILLNSYTAMLVNKDSRYAFEGAVLSGAGIGAATGSFAGGVGALPGSFLGANASIPFAFAAAGSAMEIGSTFSELLLEEAGDKKLTKELVYEILNDEEAYKRIRNKAIARGLTIGAIDAITGKMGGKLTTGIITKGGKQAASQASKLRVGGAVAATGLLEGAGGSAGEAAARALIGQEMDVSEIALEGIAEAPGSVKSLLQMKLSKPTYKVRGELVTSETIDDLIDTMGLDELVNSKIEIENDYEGRQFKMQERIKKLSSEQKIIQANPNINTPTLKKITELQLELDNLKGNETEVAKEKASLIRKQIKELQETQLEEELDTDIKTSFDSLEAEEKLELRTKAIDALDTEGVENPSPEDIDNKALSILNDEVRLLSDKPKKKTIPFAEGLGKTKDISDVMEGGVEIDMDGTKVIMTESKGGITLESIETPDADKGQGKAEAALKKITDKANIDGVNITLKVAPKDATVDAGRLENLYGRNGFEMQEDGVTMVRVPQKQSFFGDSVNENVEQVSDNLAINKKDSSLKGFNKVIALTKTSARLAAKTIKQILPDVKIVLHESQSEYVNNTTPLKKGELASSGEYNPNTKTIHINLPNSKASTVAHEVFHAVLLDRVRNNDALAKKISDDMVRVVQSKLPENDKLRLAVEKHSKTYEGKLQTEEQIAELIGLLSSKEFGYTQLKRNIKDSVKNYLVNLAKKLGIPLPNVWGSDQEVVDLINTLARKTRTGEEITKEDVKLLDVKEDAKVDSEAKSRKQIASKSSSVEMFENPDILQPKRMANGRTKVIDLGRAFDKRARDNGTYIPIPKDGVYTNSQLNKIADAMTDDAELQLKQDDSGIGWYDLKTKSAMELMSRIHPELSNSNSKSHLEFTLMVALISQNNSVGINFRQANDAYTYYKNNNKLPDREYAGKSGNIIKQNIALAFEAIKSKGWENYKNTLQETKTVKEWEAEGYKVNGENKTTEITGAMAMLGSKIGSFWGNLNGDFSTLTADLWFSRMFNRHTGNVVSKKGSEKSKQATLNELKKYKGKTLLNGYKKSDILKGAEVFDKWLNTIVKEYANGGYKDKQPLNIVSNTHFKNTKGELQDIPRGGKERNTMRDVVKRVQDKLIERGYPKLDIADIQAILWYNEKDLYRLYKAVNKSSEKTDYETAAQEVLREQGINAEVALPFKASKSSTDGGRKQTDTVQSKSVSSEIKTITRQQRTDRLAPNGKRSNLNDEQYDIVRTPAFKRWFGDWESDPANASKVVDKNGEPQVVWRGRDKTKGDVGDIIDIGKTKEGAFFADNKEAANLFMSEFVGLKKGEYEVIESFLNIRNPEVFENFWNDFLSSRYSSGNGRYTPNKNVDGAIIKDDVWLQESEIDWKEGQFDEFGNELDEEIIKEIALEGKQFIALDSKQIKLADGSNTTFDPSKPSIRQQKGIQQAMENGEVIQTDSELIFFKGMQPKMKNGKPFSVHKIKKGSFAALDKNIALDYKGDKPLKQFTIPEGTTVEVVNLPSDEISIYRRNEEKAIDASDAQVVKLVTIDSRGKSQQYVIKDDAILKTSKDVKEDSVTSKKKETFTVRQQKGLINFTEKDAIKFSKIGVNDARTIQAMNSIGLSGVKFTEEGVNKKIKETLDKLYQDADNYLLSKDSQEVTKLIQFGIEAEEERGASEREINFYKSQLEGDGRKEYILGLKKTQEETADQWVSYLKESDYSDAFKYLMLDAVLTHNYDLKRLEYKKRTNTTVRNISPFDAGTLAMLYASDSKNLLKSYVEMQKENLDNIINASQVKSTEGGKWLKFDGGPNAANLQETANSLSQLVQDTYWCTKTNALGQLKGGDFYVYVTGKTPRIAIRMEGDSVGEVRGNASSKQDLEGDMLPVADKFLKDNIPNDSGKKWLDSIAFNKKAKEFLNNMLTDGIGEKEIKEYVSIISEGERFNTDYGENGFVTKIKKEFKRDNIKPEVRELVAFGVTEFNPKTTKYLIGDLNFQFDRAAYGITDLGNLEFISGDADFGNSKITSLGNLKTIGGDAHFGNSNVTSLGNLESIGGDANFFNSKVTDLGNLKSIGGEADFRGSNITSLGNLKSIGGDAHFISSKVTDLGNLESIGGYADFVNSKITSLGNLKTIGENAYFGNSKITSLGNLESIGGSADFYGSKITSLGNLESIGGGADFRNSKITDLGNLKSIGGYAYFNNSKITDLGNLKSVGGGANFGGNTTLENEWKRRQGKPPSRQQKGDAVGFIKNARSQGISEAAIKIILSNKGLSAEQISNAFAKSKGKASKVIKLSEKFSKGFDRVMKEIDGIIKKTKSRKTKEDTSPQALLNNTLPYLEGTKVYENATDVQREKMIRELRSKLGIKEKSAPSISRILGNINDVKNIIISEKELLIKRIKDIREGASTAVKAIKISQKEIISGVRELKKAKKINTNQLMNIISRINRLDVLSPSDVDEFFDFMSRVFNDAEYVEKIKNANLKRDKALQNIPRKIGIADAISPTLVKIFSINASLIPDVVFDKYIKLVNQFGESASVLTLSSIKVVERTASEILNKIDLETSKIPQLQDLLESFENKVVDSETGKLNYSETIKNMLKDEVINESDYEVMKKYKSEILPKKEKVKKTDAEILKEKKDIIRRLKRRKELNVENLPSRFEVERARIFKKLIKNTEILMRFSVPELKQIEKLIGNIRNGYFPSLANQMIVKFEGQLNADKLSMGIKKGKLLPKARLKSNLQKLFGAGNSILKEIKSTPLFFIDQVFGNFKESLIRSSLFDGLAKQIEQFESSYKKVSGRIDKAQLAVFKSFKNRPNEALMSNFKQMAYLIQLEYDTNIGNPETKHQAKAYIEKTIQAIDDGASTYSDRDAEMLSTILKDFSENGEISLDKLYDSFNSAEKNSIKVIQEVNAELGPIAQQTANVIRGEGITARNNYVHLNVINEKGSDPMANEAFIDGYTKSLKPSTRSKSLIKRQGVVSPLNFDVYASALKGAKGTLLDFHMTDAVRTANATIKSTEDLLKGNEPRMSSENREKFNAIKEAYDTVLRIQFTNAYYSTTFVEDALNWISKNGYRTMLAGSTRLVAEFSSNSAFALLTNPKALINGAKIGIGFLNSDAAPQAMINLNSTAVSRTYPNEDLSGRMIDVNLMNKKKGLKGARAKNKYMNKLTQVWNVTGDKYVNSVATLADGLISSPDKAIMRPVWFGAFSNEFKKITGVKPNFDKIASNDTNYMDANQEALDAATKHADEESIYTGSTSNPFYGILKGQSMPTDTSFTKAYNAFNNFMLTFLMYEYMTVRTGVVSAMGQGSLSKTKGASLIAASATRMIMYTMMVSVMGELMSNLVGGDDEEKDIKSLDKRLGQSIASTLLTISLGKSGNAYRSIINFLAEGANEEYLDMLRDGGYDIYKDGLAFQTIPKEKTRGTELGDILLNAFAAYGPAIKTVDFMLKKATEPEKRTDAAKERREKELKYRLPLEILGNTGLIPMYKDVRKVVLGNIYNDIGSGSQEQKNYQKKVKEMNKGFGNDGFGNGGLGNGGF